MAFPPPNQPIQFERYQTDVGFAKKAKTQAGIVPNLNSVRGLACLMVVALHVVGDTDSNGLHLPMTSAWHYVMASIEFLRMPLFTALSGYLYAGQRVKTQNFSLFWSKKLRRVAVPLVFATFVFWSLQSFSREASVPLIDALLFGLGHLWYLQALLLLFAAISVADALFRPQPATMVLVGLAMIMFCQMGIPVTTFLGLAGALYLGPYFLFGIILREQPEWLRDPRAGLIALGIIVIILTSQQLGMAGLANEVTLLQLPAAIAGMAGVVFLMQRFPQNALLAKIGSYSYTIYLWHIMASAAVRNLMLKADISSVPALFIVSFAAAVAAPIVLYHVARRIPVLSVAVTGERWLLPVRKSSNVKRGDAVA